MRHSGRAIPVCSGTPSPPSWNLGATTVLLPEINLDLVGRIRRFYREHGDAPWSAGFISIYLGETDYPEDPSDDVLNAIAFLVVEGELRPEDTLRGTTFYHSIDKPNELVKEDAEPQPHLFDPDSPGG
jgi:hypothetical protein